jgi:hypothetical protein
VSAFDRYVQATDARITAERRQPMRPLPGGAQAIAVWEMPSPSIGTVVEVPDALVNHWRGRTFVPHVELATVLARVRRVETLLRQPDVVTARILPQGPDRDLVMLAITRSQVLTAHYDTEHDVRYTTLGPGRVASDSVATRIREVAGPGELAPREDRGFLWALRAWWRYEAVPGGVLIECESVSLSRSVPYVVRPVVGPMVTRFARESLERTLLSLRAALTT